MYFYELEMSPFSTIYNNQFNGHGGHNICSRLGKQIISTIWWQISYNACQLPFSISIANLNL